MGVIVALELISWAWQTPLGGVLGAGTFLMVILQDGAAVGAVEEVG